MNGLSELVEFILPYILISFGLLFFIFTFIVKKKIKLLTIFLCAICAFLFFQLKSCEKENYKKNQLEQVGIYYLTQYQNCDNCYAILKENMTYNIVKNRKIVESGKWHYEIGGDYFITYLENGNQLGSGNYEYGKYVLKYKQE